MAGAYIKKLTEDSFDHDIASGTVLVDFYADWCGPCRMMNPILEQLSEELHGNVTIAKLDIDHAQRIATTYQITSIPTVILFKQGKEAGRLVGLKDKEGLKKFIHS